MKSDGGYRGFVGSFCKGDKDCYDWGLLVVSGIACGHVDEGKMMGSKTGRWRG